MTIIEMPRDTDLDTPRDMSDGEARAHAKALLDADPGLTGAQVGERCGRSAAWGRNQKVAWRKARSATPRATADATPPARSAPPAATPRATPPKTAAPRPRHAPATRHWADTAIVLVVALVAAAASYGHMRHVALMAGEAEWLAWLFPLTVDGLAVAALRRGEQGRPWLVLALAVSVLANVGAQFPDAVETAAPAVFAWPPLALYGTHRLLRMGH